MAAPIPLAAPVTSAVRPVSGPSVVGVAMIPTVRPRPEAREMLRVTGGGAP
jgi:hypothetical protein